MSTLTDLARRHIASLVADLEGEEDFMPFMTLNGPCGHAYVGLMMPDDPDGKDNIADFMTATCMVYRADEAVFVSTSWMVVDTDRTRALAVPPSQNPNRTEVVFMVHVTGDGDAAYHAAVTREDNRVSLGQWESMQPEGVGGRFGEAVHLGMLLGRKLTPEMCDYMDEQLAQDKEQELIGSIVRALATVKEEAFKK